MQKFIVYQGPINHVGTMNLQTLVLSAVKDGATELCLLLCSGGGDVTSGIGIFNFLKSLPVQISIHNFGMCGSIAATMFLAGARRTTAKASMFSLHAATYVDGSRVAQVSENTSLISAPFRQIAHWDDDRIQKYFSSGLEQYISPDDSVEFGMAHEVLDLEIPEGAEILNVFVP
ncbi:ATP-dependent Clp protease proteolytic subunit [Undibacterium amnicola]|uniref:ATP-dependent Clp protease proteolytic subunit n=1 Tax=Undibacterium amnicola TaxID=1834038 RepID=A0ABR6XPP0_9BURK|nr:ATP-dependent Clp protease proteolytic subunit [Undibacterium amnicola]